MTPYEAIEILNRQETTRLDFSWTGFTVAAYKVGPIIRMDLKPKYDYRRDE